MFGIVIDSQGFKVEFVALNKDGTPQYYVLKVGETIITRDWQIANGMNKPRYGENGWIDTDPLPPQPEVPSKLSELELLKEEVLLLKKEVKNLEEENEGLKNRLNATENAVLELMMIYNNTK